jgi:tRNA(fMet)-specific endonuclease VapC
MLDTNMASYIIRDTPPQVRLRLAATPPEAVVVSVVTKAELLCGVARKGSPATLARLVDEFLRRVRVLPWDDDAAVSYARVAASCTAAGITLAALDLMIAAHAVATEAVLVTHDAAFTRVPDGTLTVEDWATDRSPAPGPSA